MNRESRKRYRALAVLAAVVVVALVVVLIVNPFATSHKSHDTSSKATAQGALKSLRPLKGLKVSPPATWSTTTYSTGPDADDHIDVYAPDDGLSHPGFFFVHGGGWTVDTVDSYNLSLVEGVCRNNNWICGIAYYPTTADSGSTVHDTENSAVLADLNEFRAQSNVITSKVALYGQSAGGQLGALVAYQNPTKVAAVVLSSGPTNMITEETSTYNQGGINIKADVDYYEGETFAQSWANGDLRFSLDSPISWVTSATPPTFGYGDTSDTIVPSAQVTALANSLASHGVLSHVFLMSGSTHCPDAQIPTTPAGNTKSALQQAIDFVNALEGN